jgi:tRNA threonylcarbamoyl adenosine modification protein YjeE
MCAAPSPSPWMFPELTFTLADEQATQKLATMLARFAVVGDLIRLEGDLGAGKSTFSKYFIQALGHKGEVPSPTYTLVQTYDQTRVPVAHVDCYRLKEPSELEGLGLEEYRRGGILLVEWPDKGGDLVAEGQPDIVPYHINNPDNGGTLTVALEGGSGASSRTVTLRGSKAWQHRYGLMGQFVNLADNPIPQLLSRPVTDTNRKAFLDGVGLKDYSVSGLAPEWSFRSYWRVAKADGSSAILMDAPPPFEGVTTFANVSAYYDGIGLRVAKIMARDDAQGYLLSEDMGDTRLLEVVQDGGDEEGWYSAAVDVLTTLCHNKVPEWGRIYSAKDWFIETARFCDWYMPMVRGKQTSPDERAAFAALWQPLFPKVMQVPTGLMPWDYQATNMMILGDEPKVANMGLIDIQDARVAPICQDLAILLRDIRRGRDDGLEQRMLDRAAATLKIDRATLQEAVEVANIQHCVRIVGGLARSALRDGKWGGADRFMARTWEVARQSYACPLLKELVAFLQPLEEAGLKMLETRKAA